MEEQKQTSLHIIILTVFTGLSLLLDIVIAISGWETLAMVFVSGAVAICWGCHFAQVGSEKQRLYFYVFVMLVILGYYAFQGPTITDVPIVLCLLIIVLSSNRDQRLIYLVAASYLVYLLEDTFITRYLSADTEQIVFSRIGLGICCLIGAALISVYFMKQNEKKNAQLQKVREELFASQKENERFLSNMSHELRTPINAVNGVSEILLGSDLPRERKEEVLVIRSAGRRLYRQVSDVLDFSEIQTGHFSLSNENYEISSVVNDAINTVFEGQESKELDFAVDIECTMPKTLYGDAGRLKKLLVCLLDNSVKFTDVGGGYLYISKREESYGINLNIDLWDTGCGIEPDKLEQLFGGSYQGDTSAERKKGGLGLGLSIAHGIISAMHGFISIQSTPDEGTHVRVSIPQEVKNREPSIDIAKPERLKILCYFNRDKYVRTEIGKYYYTFVEHLRSAFHMEVQMASSLEEVKQLYKPDAITNLLAGEWEYRMETAFFDRAAENTSVCVFANKGFCPEAGSQINVIYKPVLVLTVVNYLNRTAPGTDEDKTGIVIAREDNRKRALVVDDDEMNLVVARGILEKLGISAEICDSGKTAIEKCSITDFDIIFMDYMMPNMDGTKAMKRIREIRNGFYKQKPVVVFTANAVSGAKESFLKEGFDAFLAKPVEIKEMKKILRTYVEGFEK